MATQYLYGDSEPFPHQTDFLATLKDFVSSAARALVLQQQADDLEREVSDTSQTNLHHYEAVQVFLTGVVDVIAEHAVSSSLPQSIGAYSNALIGYAEKMAAEARAAQTREADDRLARATVALRERRSEMREVLSRYLQSQPFEVRTWAVKFDLVGGEPTAKATLTYADGLITESTLEVPRDARWARTRRVADFLTGLNVQVGFKRAFLRSSLAPDVVQLDEYVLTAFDLGPEAADLSLRRRTDDPRDGFEISVEPGADGDSVVRITRLDAEHGSETPHVAQSEDAMRLEAFVDVLRSECQELLKERRRLVSAKIDGTDVFERHGMMSLLSKVVDRLAPIASEVSRRSPNPNELSLKLERADGRREELYIRKRDLAAHVSGLQAESAALFQRLAIFPLVDSATGAVLAVGGSAPPATVVTPASTPAVAPAAPQAASPAQPLVPSGPTASTPPTPLQAAATAAALAAGPVGPPPSSPVVTPGGIWTSPPPSPFAAPMGHALAGAAQTPSSPSTTEAQASAASDRDESATSGDADSDEHDAAPLPLMNKPPS